MIWAPDWSWKGTLDVTGRDDRGHERWGYGGVPPLYQDTARPVYSFILSLTRNPEEAEDVMQDTYLTVWTKAGSYVPQGKPLAWVFTIARNLCYMRFREQKMKADVALEDLAEKEEGGVLRSPGTGRGPQGAA